MSEPQGYRFRIGVFVLGSFLLLGVLIVLFGRVPAIFRGSGTRYYIEFDNAPGISIKTPVRRSGVRIGEVESVELDDQSGKVRVAILIDRPHKLFEDDQPRLIRGALSGDTAIDIVAQPRQADESRPREEHGMGRTVIPAGLILAQQPAGKGGRDGRAKGERKPAPPGTVFQGTTQVDMANVLGQLSELAPPARDAFADMRRTLDSYEKLTPLMQETMREIRDLARASKDIVPELRRTNEEVRELAKASRETIPDLRRTSDEITAAARNWGRLGERVDILVQTNEKAVNDTLKRLNDTLIQIGNVLSEENQRNLTATLRNVSAGSKNLEGITRQTEDLIKESRNTLRHVTDSVSRADEVLSNLNKATKPLSERSEPIMRNLEESTDRLNKTLGETRDLLRNFNQSDGAVQKFLSDPTLYNSLNDTVMTVSRIMPRLDRILKDLEVFADKIARHPESLGIGGAVRPSAGLKESPFSSSYRQRGSGP